MKFSKMHSLGNDYIFLNTFEEEITSPSVWAKVLCHRRFGVGSDGFILVEPSSSALFRMRIFNADGSEAEMCGNGLRCFGKYVYERHLTQERQFWVETRAGLRFLELELEQKQEEVLSIRADMGTPIFERSHIPMLGEAGFVLEEPLTIQGHSFHVSALSMGNPHLIIFVEQLKDFPVSYWGPLFEKDSRFPQGVNIEFVEQKSSHELFQRTWERGCGETYACGTGACAAGVVSILQGKGISPLEVRLLGGSLHIEWQPQHSVFLSGPASWICEGEISREWFLKNGPEKIHFLQASELFLG